MAIVNSNSSFLVHVQSIKYDPSRTNTNSYIVQIANARAPNNNKKYAIYTAQYIESMKIAKKYIKYRICRLCMNRYRAYTPKGTNIRNNDWG